jgi:hypothetical protein
MMSFAAQVTDRLPEGKLNHCFDPTNHFARFAVMTFGTNRMSGLLFQSHGGRRQSPSPAKFHRFWNAGWRGMAITFCLFRALLAATPAWPAPTAAPDTHNAVIKVDADGTAPSLTMPARLWKNFSVLIPDVAGLLAATFARLAGYSLLAGIAGFLAGILAGILLWLWLRKRGVFDASHGWIRYCKWVCALLFPASAALGLAYAFAWLQAGYIAKGAILHDRLLERTVACVYAAVAMDAAKHEISGKETMAEVGKILQESDDLSQILHTNLGALVLKNFQGPEVKEMLGDGASEWINRIAESQAGRLALEKAADNAEARLVLLAFYAIATGNQAPEEYVKGHPKTGPAVVLAREFLQRVDHELVRLINALVYPQVIVAILVGLGLPLLIAGLLLIAASSTRPKPASAGKGVSKKS